MSVFRSRLRLVAVAWLLCQVASLSAFMPEDCCAMHKPVVAETSGESDPCHETEKAPPPPPKSGDDCPMDHGEGEACPMHRSSTDDCCGMSSGCEGPSRPLANLFAFAAVLDAPVASMSAPDSSPAAIELPVPLLGRLVSPDAPPPKA